VGVALIRNHSVSIAIFFFRNIVSIAIEMDILVPEEKENNSKNISLYSYY
jgi:hypothetical protein